MLTARTLPELLDAFSSSDPTPGGGSAAALTGAVSASLFAMVAGLPKTRAGTPEEREALDGARTRLLALREALVDLVNRDAAAYDAVVAAYRLPKATDEDKAARKAAIQAALRHAAEVPLETARAAADALEQGAIVARHGNPSAVTDIIVGMQLAMAASGGAILNVDANLGGLSDASVVEMLVAATKDAMQRSTMGVSEMSQLPIMLDHLRDARARGLLTHGAPPPGVKPEMLAGTAALMLQRMATPEARRALETLAASADANVASAVRAVIDQQPPPSA